MKKKAGMSFGGRTAVIAVVGVIVIILLALGIYLLEGQNKQTVLSALSIERIEIKSTGGAPALQGLVYVASTSSEQMQGLMGVTSFGNCNGIANSQSSCIGMIFVFSGDENLCFWMQDTLIALQQVWISPNGTVTSIYQAQPKSETTVCHTGMYVLETSPSALISVGDIANQT